MLVRHWMEMCGMLQLAVAAIARHPWATVDSMRQLSGVGATQVAGAALEPVGADKPVSMLGLRLLAGVGLSTASAVALASTSVQQSPVAAFENIANWTFSDTKVVSKGSVDYMTEGEFTRDFILESKVTATSKAGSVVPDGTLKLVLSAFSPAYDQHGRRKGAWYVWGKWTLTDSHITHSSRTGRQNTGEISGRLSAELDFNPIVTQKNWTAKIRLPMTRIAPVSEAGSSQPARGEGALIMDNMRGGTISLNLKLWPKMQH